MAPARPSVPQTPSQARLALTRALLWSIPIATLAFMPLDLLSHADQTAGLTAARVLLIFGFGLAAWRLPHFGPAATRWLTFGLSVMISVAIALLVQGTGGIHSPAFNFTWSIPLVVGLLFMTEPASPAISGVTSIPLGIWQMHADGKTAIEIAYWVGITVVAIGIGTTASIFYRRLQRLEIAQEKEAERRLAHADRLASLGSLAAGMAHEINNPLASVMANLTFLGENLKTGDEADLRASLVESEAGSERIRGLVRDLLTFARQDPTAEELGSCDLDQQIKLSLAIARAQLAGQVETIWELAPVPSVRGNAVRIGQVFLNLLINAAQAMPPGRVGNQIRITSAIAANGRVLTEVRDNGLGINPEVLPRIFDPFFTTKDVGVGTGLGLAICHGILKAVGGEIQVESQLGKGTVFRVFLQPASPAP